MTRVHLAPADTTACGHYRLIWPGRAAVAAGYDVVVHAPGPMDWLGVQVFRGRSFLAGVLDFDVLVLQRVASAELADAIPVLRRAGVRVVIDLDDALDALDPRHPGFAALDPRRSPLSNHVHLRRAIDAADHLVVTTPALADRYGQHTPTTIVPNFVPRAWFGIGRDPHDGVLIGWSGRHATHVGDLDVTRGALDQVCRSTGARFDVLGDHPVPLDAYPHEIAQYDVGIAPLRSTPFNEAKSDLKPLEYAALGVPYVASPTGPYRAFGAGVLATRPKDWVRELRRLVLDQDHRAEQIERGLQVARGRVLEDHVDQYVEAWAGEAVQARRAA